VKLGVVFLFSFKGVYGFVSTDNER